MPIAPITICSLGGAAPILVFDAPQEDLGVEGERVQRLPEVVAGGGEESALRLVCGLRAIALLFDAAHEV